MSKLSILILSPAVASSNNGNWRTAERWQRFLAPAGPVRIAQDWQGEDIAAVIALNARRSADSIARLRRACPHMPLAVVLTGTDVYAENVADDLQVQHSLECASHIVVLQAEALRRLKPAQAVKARVILQSAPRLLRHDKSQRSFDLVAVGHLRDEKDPLTLMQAARQLDAQAGLRIIHIGAALDPALGDAARRTMQDCPHYRWLGGLPAATARRWIARSRALVHMSRLEGGAHVVIEALRSAVPVLASRIDGNVGLLGPAYEGYFPVGDAAALTALILRLRAEPAWAARLQAQSAEREPLFMPAAEAGALRVLLADMLSA